MRKEDVRFNAILIPVLLLGILFAWLSEHEKKPKAAKPEIKVTVTVKCDGTKGEKHVLQGTIPNVLSNTSSIRR